MRALLSWGIFCWWWHFLPWGIPHSEKVSPPDQNPSWRKLPPPDENPSWMYSPHANTWPVVTLFYRAKNIYLCFMEKNGIFNQKFLCLGSHFLLPIFVTIFNLLGVKCSWRAMCWGPSKCPTFCFHDFFSIFYKFSKISKNSEFSVFEKKTSTSAAFLTPLFMFKEKIN